MAEYAACRAAELEKRIPRYRHIAAFRRGHLLARLQRWQEAEDSLQTSAEEAGRMRLSQLQLNIMRSLLGMYQVAGEHGAALRCAQRVEQLARSARDDATRALALDVEGDAHLALGHVTEALHQYEQSLDLYRNLEDTGAQFVVKQDIARLYRTSGQWDKAVRWLEVCLREEQMKESRHRQASLSYDLACLHIHRGELAEAGAYLQHSIAMFRQAEDRAGADLVGRTLVGLSILMHRQATAHWLTYADIERGSAKVRGGEEG
jgi:tetratricopeptide (TPR) repeat protein